MSISCRNHLQNSQKPSRDIDPIWFLSWVTLKTSITLIPNLPNGACAGLALARSQAVVFGKLLSSWEKPPTLYDRRYLTIHSIQLSNSIQFWRGCSMIPVQSLQFKNRVGAQSLGLTWRVIQCVFTYTFKAIFDEFIFNHLPRNLIYICESGNAFTIKIISGSSISSL